MPVIEKRMQMMQNTEGDRRNSRFGYCCCWFGSLDSWWPCLCSKVDFLGHPAHAKPEAILLVCFRLFEHQVKCYFIFIFIFGKKKTPSINVNLGFVHHANDCSLYRSAVLSTRVLPAISCLCWCLSVSLWWSRVFVDLVSSWFLLFHHLWALLSFSKVGSICSKISVQLQICNMHRTIRGSCTFCMCRSQRARWMV